MVKRAVTVIFAALTLCTGAAGAFLPARGDGRLELPVVMYHSVSKVGIGDYVVPPKVLEADFEFLKERGYKTVSVEEVANFVIKGAELPEKPILITFDDGFYNNLVYALPLFEKYNFKATVNVVGAFSERENGKKKRSCSYSYLNEKELAEMAKSGLVEFGNHSYDMHALKGRRGVMRKRGESEQEYKEAFTADCKKCGDFVKRACGAEPKVFAYPFGSYSKSTPKLLNALGYNVAFTCAEGVNRLKKGDTARLMWLKRINRPAKLSSKRYFEKLGIK